MSDDTRIAAGTRAAAAAYRSSQSRTASAAIRHDYNVLSKLAYENNWTENSPVDVALLGILWPDGPPEDWPEEARKEAIAYDESIREKVQSALANKEKQANQKEIRLLKKQLGRQESEHKQLIDQLTKRFETSSEQVGILVAKLEDYDSLKQSHQDLQEKLTSLEDKDAIQRFKSKLEDLNQQEAGAVSLFKRARTLSKEVKEFRDAQNDIKRPLDFWMNRTWRHWWQFLFFGVSTVMVGLAGIFLVLVLMVLDTNDKKLIAQNVRSGTSYVIDCGAGYIRWFIPLPEKEMDPVETVIEDSEQEAEENDTNSEEDPPEDPLLESDDPEETEEQDENEDPTTNPLYWFPWQFGLTALLSAMLLLLLRILTKITLSNLHLSTEAQERVVMAHTYFDFITKRKSDEEDNDQEPAAEPTDEERRRQENFRKLLDKSIIDAMFRPTTTGLVKDDSASPTLLEKAAGGEEGEA